MKNNKCTVKANMQPKTLDYKKTLGYAVIGCGRISKQHIPVVDSMPGGRLVAVVDSNPDHARLAVQDCSARPALYSRYQDALDDKDVDVVVICAPTQMHAEITVAAARAGKHIYCEKAMASNVNQCQQMINETRKHGVKLTIGQSTRFQPYIIAAKDVVATGVIGKPYAVNAQFSRSVPRGAAMDSWKYRAGATGNGYVINLGCHYIDTARFLLDQDPTSVSACIENLFSRELMSEDQAAIISSCLSGFITIAMYSSFEAKRTPTDGYSIRGSEGNIFLPNTNEMIISRGNNTEKREIPADLASENGFQRLHRMFRDAIETGDEAPMTGRDAMLNLEWGLGAYLSNERKTWINLPLDAEHKDFTGPITQRTISATHV